MNGAAAPVDLARWRCGGCGRYLPATVVSLDAAGVPWAVCPHHPPVPVTAFYERTPMTTDPAAAKTAGQEQSIFDLPEVARASFLQVVSSLDPGALVSVNTVRARLDALEVPAKSRGALFAEAVREGLLEPLFVEAGGVRVAAREPSTGKSAKLATVRLYRRTGGPS